MEMLKNNNEVLTFLDVVGDGSVMREIIFLPKIKAFETLKSLKQAKDKLSVLSTMVFDGKSVITHGTIFGREYLLYYSNKGHFESNRILDKKLDSLSFFSYDGMRLVVLLGRELPYMLKMKDDILSFFREDELSGKEPRVVLIFESEKIKMSRTVMSFHLYDTFEKSEVIFFLGEEIQDIQKKSEGSFLLC